MKVGPLSGVSDRSQIDKVHIAVKGKVQGVEENRDEVVDFRNVGPELVKLGRGRLGGGAASEFPGGCWAGVGLGYRG
jgi:hypothetical protein